MKQAFPVLLQGLRKFVRITHLRRLPYSMNERDLLLQRYCDGELDAETAAGVKTMLATDEQAAARVAQLDLFAAALSQSKHDPVADRDLARQVLARIGASRPLRSVQTSSASAGSILVIGFTTVAVILMLSMRGNLSAFLPMALIATILLGLGILGILAANPLRTLEKSLLGKLLRRRLTVAPAEVLSYRVAGLIMAIGALWMLFS